MLPALSGMVGVLLMMVNSHLPLLAASMSDNFESYVSGNLDSNTSGGPNSGSSNPWWGPGAPNFRIQQGAWGGCTPHSGSKMIWTEVGGGGNVGGYGSDNDQMYYNLAYRLGGGSSFGAGVVLEWWFYDPVGNNSNAAYRAGYNDCVALCYYGSGIPATSDYASGAPAPGSASQRLMVGGLASSLSGVDTTKYQARIVGNTDGISGGTSYYNTATTRSAGWHHGRIVTAGDGASVKIYIDDMVNPTLSKPIVATGNARLYNCIQVESIYPSGVSGTSASQTPGFFDDFAFQSGVVPPTLGAGPVNQSVLLGSNVTFSVSGAAGTPAPAYYWQQNGVNLTNGGRISGADTTTLNVTGLLQSDGGTYSCLVSNMAGGVVSNALLTIIMPPTPTNMVPACGPYAGSAGGSVTLTVQAFASNPFSYQWLENGVAVNNGPSGTGSTFSGSATSSLTISGLSQADNGSYSCLLTNSDGATNTCAVVLTVTACPAINSQSGSLVLAATSNATFTVNASGTSLGYQWSKNSAPLGDGGRISGATSSSLTISSVADADDGSYSCLITNTCASTNSVVVTLTVIDPPIITNQPVSVVTVLGGSAALHVGASGGSAAYQWQRNGAPVAGGTGPDLVITNAGWCGSGSYSVTLSNLAASVTSATATLVFTSAYDGFESYTTGELDFNGSPNNNQCLNPWWGDAPPNGMVVGKASSINPHSRGDGTGHMVGGDGGYVHCVDDINIAYRLNAGQRYQGNFKMDWWYFDPVGPTASPTLGDYMVIGYYNLPSDHDYDSTAANGTKILWLGAYPFAGCDPSVYQAKITGETDGVSGSEFYNTTGARSIGWHHFRMVFGIPNGADTPVSFYIDDMINPVMTHAKFFAEGLDCVEINSHQNSASDATGYFDDWAFQSGTDPWIIEQPVSLAVPTGQPAALQIVANCTGYQWKKNGGPISGATDSAYAIASAGSGDVATYTCLVTGSAGTVESAAATLSLMDTLGTGTGLMATYFMGTNLDYDSSAQTCYLLDPQVLFDGTGVVPPSCPDVGNVDFSVRWTGTIQPTNTGDYTFYTRTDDGARLWVGDQLVINHWAPQPPTEWWSAPITLQAGQSYPIKLEYFQAGGGDYWSLSWGADSMPKAPIPTAVLYPSGAPAITTQPANQYANISDPVSFSVTAAGAAPLSYQWYYNDTNDVNHALDGQTNATLSLPSVQEADGLNLYFVSVSNSYGTTNSAVANLFLYNGSSVVVVPHTQVITNGGTATFTFRASGCPVYGAPPWFTVLGWYLDDNPIPGAADAVLTVTDVGGASAGKYSIEVEGNGWDTTSGYAYLIVTNPPPSPLPAGPARFISVNLLPDQSLRLTATGTVNAVYCIDAMTNLVSAQWMTATNWCELCRRTNTTGTFQFTEPATNRFGRFYRTRSGS